MYYINDLLLSTSLILLFSIAVYCLMHRKLPGATSLFIQVTAGFIWTLASYLEIHATGLESKILWRNVQQIGIYIIPISNVLFAVDYSKQIELKKYVNILAVVPIAALVLIFTDQFHHIMRSGYSLVENSSSASGQSLVVQTSTVGTLFLAVNFFIPLLGIIILLDFRRNLSSHFKNPVLLIIFSILMRPVLSLLKVAFLDPFNIYIPMAVLYAPSGIILFYCIFKYGFLSLSPIARDKVFDVIGEGIMVLDQEGKIIDRNPNAVKLTQKYFNVNHELIGMSFGSVFLDEADISEAIKRKQDANLEIKLNIADANTYLLCNIYPLSINGRDKFGTVIILSDITEKKHYELNLIKEADRDSLTQLFNRRGFITYAVKALEEASKDHKIMSVFMIDIDHFKKINDTYGHIKGDKVLQNLAAILRETLREQDIIGRIGGEEFAIVLPNIDKNEAFLIAERIRTSVEKSSFRIADHDIYINYTVSIGVSDSAACENTLEQLLHNADMALYEAKRKSRNCSFIYE